MMYNKDDVIYILENNTTIRKGKIARKQGDNYIIQLIGSCGALTMPEDQLFESEEAAEKSRQQIKLNSADSIISALNRRIVCQAAPLSS